MAVDIRTRNAWDIVVNGLASEGVKYVFGLPGDPRHLYDALAQSDIPNVPKAIGVRYETSGAFMAMAFARATGDLAACFGCPGPGVANLVPGILEAYSGCTPMLVLGVRASRQTDGMGAFQETDHIGMLRPITKWATTIETSEKIAWTIRRAAHIARTGKPGPVYVELPSDVAYAEVDEAKYQPAPIVAPPAPNPEAVRDAADLIEAARKPLIIVGGGAYLSGAGDAISDLASMSGIAIQTTPAGRSTVPETHPLFVGLTGLYRTTVPREIFEEADLIITAGSRMEEFQGGFLPRPANPKIVQIEIDPFEIGRNWLPDVAIESDCRLAIEALGAELARRGHQSRANRTAEIESRRLKAIADAAADALAPVERGDMPLSGKSVVHMINEVFTEKTILVKENGGQDLWAYYWPYYQVREANCCVAPAEQTAMGYGIIGAMAVKLGRPNHYVVSTSGDGAFQMSIHELGTAAQIKTPVTWVVLDDGAFGWVQWIQRRNPGSHIVATDFEPHVDLVAVATACGCSAERLSDSRNLRAALERAKAANDAGKPHVLVVPIDQAHHHVEFDRFHDFEPAPGSATA
jgi:acetolactate synthase I/II/III large subunit